MKIIALAASQREGSYNQQLAGLGKTLLEEQGHEVQLLPYADCLAPLFDDGNHSYETLPDAIRKLVDAIKQADAILISVPEYNWSIPGHLKNTIDWLSCLRPYPIAGKPMLLCSASPSRRGGLLGITHLQTICAALGAHVHPQFFALGQAYEAFNEQGALKEAALQQEYAAMLTDFVTVAKALTNNKL